MSAYSDAALARIKETLSVCMSTVVLERIQPDLSALEGYIAGLEKGVEARKRDNA